MDSRRCWKDLDTLAKCPICSETLEDPKTLPCLHSFCLLCLDNLARSERRRHQHEITCPICQTSILIPEENTFRDLPTSFHLERLKEILAVSNRTQGAITCQSCKEGKSAISYCFVCEDYLCSKCDKAHRRLRITRDHDNILLQNEPLQYTLKRPIKCSQEYHEKEALLHYCQQCDECICDICYDENHRRHDVVDIQLVAREGKKQLNKALKKAEKEMITSQDEMKENEDILKSREHEICTARRNVKSIVKELIKSLKEHEKAVLTKMDDIYEQQQKSHAIKQRKLELFVTRLRSPVELGKCVLRRNVDVEILNEQKAIIDRCEDLLNSRETKAPEFAFVNYEIDEEIRHIVQMLGPGKLIESNTDPSRSTARVRGSTEPVVSKKTKVLLCTRDSGGKQCYNENDQVKVKIQSSLGKKLETAFEDQKDGTYNVTFTPESDGPHDVMISVNGQSNLAERPVRFQVRPCLYQKAFELGSNGQFLFPCGIAINKDNGNVAVADSVNKRVQIFDSKGNYLREFGDIRDSTKNLQRPYSVAFSMFGEIIVIQEDGEMVFCSKEGNFLNYAYGISGDGKPSSVSVKSNGELVVCDRANAEIKILSSNGFDKVGSFASDPSLDGSPSFAIHHKDQFFVSFQDKQCVKVFSDDGFFLYDIGTQGKRKERLNSPLGLAIDKFNNLVVCDSFAGRLQVFKLNGRHVTTIEGHDNGFGSPQFVAVSEDGRLFFTDTGKKCVHVFH